MTQKQTKLEEINNRSDDPTVEEIQAAYLQGEINEEQLDRLLEAHYGAILEPAEKASHDKETDTGKMHPLRILDTVAALIFIFTLLIPAAFIKWGIQLYPDTRIQKGLYTIAALVLLGITGLVVMQLY